MVTSTFTLSVPGSWSRIDLTGDVPRAIARAADPFVRAAPLSRQPIVRRLVEEKITPSIQSLADAGAVCALVALNPFDPSPLRPFVSFEPVSPDVFGEPSHVADLRMLVRALGENDPSTEVRRVGDLFALRTERSDDSTARWEAFLESTGIDLGVPDDSNEGGAVLTEPATDRRPTAIAGRNTRVQYLLADVEDRTGWMIVRLSLEAVDSPAGRDLAQVLVDVFDASISTFRWIR